MVSIQSYIHALYKNMHTLYTYMHRLIRNSGNGYSTYRLAGGAQVPTLWGALQRWTQLQCRRCLSSSSTSSSIITTTTATTIAVLYRGGIIVGTTAAGLYRSSSKLLLNPGNYQGFIAGSHTNIIYIHGIQYINSNTLHYLHYYYHYL